MTMARTRRTGPSIAAAGRGVAAIVAAPAEKSELPRRRWTRLGRGRPCPPPRWFTMCPGGDGQASSGMLTTCVSSGARDTISRCFPRRPWARKTCSGLLATGTRWPFPDQRERPWGGVRPMNEMGGAEKQVEDGMTRPRHEKKRLAQRRDQRIYQGGKINLFEMAPSETKRWWSN